MNKTHGGMMTDGKIIADTAIAVKCHGTRGERRGPRNLDKANEKLLFYWRISSKFRDLDDKKVAWKEKKSKETTNKCKTCSEVD